MDTLTPWWNRTLFDGLTVTPARVVLGILIILLGLVISRWIGLLLGRRATKGHLDPGALYSLQRLLHYSFVAGSLMVGLAVIGFELRSIAVVAGALGIGVGLGLQSITANFVSGLILLFERPIRPGDRVSLGATDSDAAGQVNGYVQAIRLRSTSIQTPDNILLIVPNSELIGRTIVNWSKGDSKIRIRFSIGVSYDCDIDKVRQVMVEAANAHERTLREPVPEVRLIATGDSSLDFQLLVWIADPRERGRVESELRLAIVRRFRVEGITIPFPQRVVRILPDRTAAPQTTQE